MSPNLFPSSRAPQVVGSLSTRLVLFPLALRPMLRFLHTVALTFRSVSSPSSLLTAPLGFHAFTFRTSLISSAFASPICHSGLRRSPTFRLRPIFLRALQPSVSFQPSVTLSDLPFPSVLPSPLPSPVFFSPPSGSSPPAAPSRLRFLRFLWLISSLIDHSLSCPVRFPGRFGYPHARR